MKIKEPSSIDEKYQSVIEEMRRYVRHNKKIHIYYNNKEKLFDDLIIILRKYYGVPNKDFSMINSSFMIDKTKFIIEKFEKPMHFVISTKTKNGYIFTTSYLMKKTIFKHKYYIRFLEVAKSPTPVWGMKASIAKWWYKKEIRRNIRLITKSLKILNNNN